MSGYIRFAQCLRRVIVISISTPIPNSTPETNLLYPKTLNPDFKKPQFSTSSSSAGGVWRDPNRISIWRRKKEIGKEGLIVAKELKRLQSNPIRLQRYIQSNVSRLLKSDLVSVLAEFQRQNQVFLSMKLYDVVRKEIWYRPDMFFYRDMLMMLARNKKVEEAKRVWGDLNKEEVLFDQHTFGDIMRGFLDNGLPDEAMEIYDEMRQSPDPPLSLPFRVILKGLVPYPELREKVKADFLELFPGYSVYDPPEDLFEDQEWKTDSEVD
ncbi:unnamed protein product [Amaranthus hypochondriacus]